MSLVGRRRRRQYPDPAPSEPDTVDPDVAPHEGHVSGADTHISRSANRPFRTRTAVPAAAPAGTVAAPSDPRSSGAARQRPGGTIRRRVIRILALPVVAALLLLGVITVTEVGSYRAAETSARAVTLVLAVQDLVQELQTERGLASGLLGGNAALRVDELAPVRARVDEKMSAVEQRVSGGGGPESRVATAVRALDDLGAIRTATDTGSGRRAATFAYYTQRITALSDVDYDLDEAADPELRRGFSALRALSAAKEATAQQRAFLNGVYSTGRFNGDEFLQFTTMRGAKDAALAEFGRFATARQAASKDYVLDTGAARVATFFEDVALQGADGRNMEVNPQSWWSALTTVLDDMLQLQQHVGSQIQARAAQVQEDATRRVGVLLSMVVLCFAGAVYLATIASRSISRPLATLAGEANLVAVERLPAAVEDAHAGTQRAAPPPVRVPAHATDEIRSVADALDRVQGTAYALASEQAMLRRSMTESLANLGRRNQNLLRRQLGFITNLEREETDPSGLANLFELDHLATRMRRNAESLLVLVGASSPRQWSSPLPIADVIRAAVSEVQDYRRVQLRRVDDAFVAGAVVSSVAHMLAELIENGVTFSPPDSDVEIQGRRIGEDYLIAITDHGIGMSDADLHRANSRLSGEGDFVAAPTRYLGHYVVGRLADEMAIDVRLVPSPVTGITARVVLPPNVLANVPALPAPAGDATDPTRRTASRTALPSREPSGSAEPVADARAPAAARRAGDAPPAAPPGIVVEPRPVPANPRERLRPGTVEFVTLPGVPNWTPGRTIVIDEDTRSYPTVHGATANGSSHRGGTAQTAPDDTVPDREPGHPTTIDESADGGARFDERTPNGLRRRVPRARRTPAAAGYPVSAGRNGADQPAAVDDSPVEVRNRLTALRAGIRRGHTAHTEANPRQRPDSDVEGEHGEH